MPRRSGAPTVAAMNPKLLPRIGACAAVAGAAAQLIATVLEPATDGGAEEAIRVVAGSGFFVPDRFIDLLGVLLTVAGLTIVGRALAGDWIRVATPFLILMGALGCAAVVTGAAMKALAQEWERADGAVRAAYLAAFDGSRQLKDSLFFAAFLALGIYLATLAPALLQDGSFPRWLGWTSAVAACLILGGNLLSPVIGPSFLAVLAGFAVFLVTLAGLGVSLWRLASRVMTQASTRTPVAERS
jgi:hypothetical protein